ncbi:oxidoreductase [Roseomonas sp. 18066]|uniref:oxidoreductase n=1 Tax=Roseomonas sp. 18066 TaxID=2681412 RepID=UPI001358F5DC|nr:oxidoreductase [Roseomonas sp. 18066]
MTGTDSWLITGCSSGFGREIALEAIRRGFDVAATARRVEEIADLVALAPDRVVALPLDVTQPVQREACVAAVTQRFGGIGTLVNNAGRGYLAAIEEGRMEDVRQLFEVNLFAPLELTRLVLPGMRQRGQGRIVNISSIGGLVANPGSGFYASTKFALEGWSEALSKEVAPLGLQVMLVEPGPFRTAWNDRSLARGQAELADYAGTAGQRMRELGDPARQQPGDPARAAEVILDAALAASPPARLVLGASAMRSARAKLAALASDLDAWEAASGATDFADAS